MQLVLNTPGTSLVKKAGSFLVRIRGDKHKVSPEQIGSILVAAGAKISSDAILLAIEHEIDILFVDGMGQARGRIWSHRYGSVATIRKNQVAFAASAVGMRWVAGLLIQRLDAAAVLLLRLQGGEPIQQARVAQATEQIASFARLIRESAESAPTSSNKAQWRGWEGSASRVYFQTLSHLLPSAYAFAGRSRRPARDAFNCCLNYAYGILYGRVEIALIRAGIDPYLGVFHRDEYNRPVLVYDLIEGYRRWADQVVVQLCLDRAMESGHFQRRDEGLWLNEAGKARLIPAFNDYLQLSEAPASLKQLSRINQLQADCHALAQSIRQVTEG